MTTEKDSVKLSPEIEFPVVVVGIAMYLDDEEGFWSIITDCITKLGQSK